MTTALVPVDGAAVVSRPRSSTQIISDFLTTHAPELTAGEREESARVLVEKDPEVPCYTCDPLHRKAEVAEVTFWRHATPEAARAYLGAVAPVIAFARGRTRLGIRPPVAPDAPAYQVTGYLGCGGDGTVFRARHIASGLVVALKQPARGDWTAFAWMALAGVESPDCLLKLYDGIDNASTVGKPSSCTWVAREYADETLADVLARRGGSPLPIAEALSIFATCCEAVAWLNMHGIYRWSAHVRNVFRVGARWKIGDLGRCQIFLRPDDPLLEGGRTPFLDELGFHDNEARSVVDWMTLSWMSHPTSFGLLSSDPERERRLTMDDCAMLGGLLCDLVGGRRWNCFSRALKSRPYCSASYSLTGNRKIDRALSAILNRCWRGEAGGAPLLANGSQGEQTVYTDPRELRADVQRVLGGRPAGTKSPLTQAGSSLPAGIALVLEQVAQ